MKLRLLIVLFISLFPLGVIAQNYKPTFKSLQHYEMPEWIQKAKFGIYCHWNAQTASKSTNNGWYARDMYIEGHPSYKDHLKNWGHPSEVGYKDVIMSWNADKFDAKQWVDLFKRAGAKYVVTMAAHHDGFDMWDSKYQPRWNSTNYGPKVDVCAEVKKATLDAGLRWGVTTHIERTYSWVQTNKGADKSGEYAGVPYDGNLKEYEDLYMEYPDFENLGHANSSWERRSPLVSPKWWKRRWKNRVKDLIKNYDPDLFYIDGALPYTDDGGKTGFELEAFYLNHNAKMNESGESEAVFCIKDIPYHGVVYPYIATYAMERSAPEGIEEEPKLIDNSIGPWFHNGKSGRYTSLDNVINILVDAVSKNCCFMLNIPPMVDGSIDDNAVLLLESIGKWLEINGEAIYETAPWKTYGEEKIINYTTKGDNLNVFVDSKIEGTILLTSTKGWTHSDIKSIKLFGSDEKVDYEISSKGVVIYLPSKSMKVKNVFQIECNNLNNLPCVIDNVNIVPKITKNKDLEKYGADGNGLVAF